MKRLALAVLATLAIVAPAPAAAKFKAQYLALPDARFVPIGVVKATDGTLWVDAMARVQCGSHEICELREFGHLQNGAITLYAFPGNSYQAIAAGPQGTLWVVAGTYLYVYDVTGTQIATYSVTTTTGALTTPALGSDGRMWMVDFGEDLIAMTSAGAQSTYACPKFCTSVQAGRDNLLWGTGLDASYQPFLFSAKTTGAVTQYSTPAESLVIGPGSRMESVAGLYKLDSIDRHERMAPLADLTALNLDQVIDYSASSMRIWFVGSKGNETQGVLGTISEKGIVKSEAFP